MEDRIPCADQSFLSYDLFEEYLADLIPKIYPHSSAWGQLLGCWEIHDRGDVLNLMACAAPIDPVEPRTMTVTSITVDVALSPGLLELYHHSSQDLMTNQRASSLVLV